MNAAVFPRSTVKSLLVIELVESGAADRLGLTDEALALACASRNGEEAPVRVAASMLAAAGRDVTALECGTHWPTYEPAARTLAAAHHPHIRFTTTVPASMPGLSVWRVIRAQTRWAILILPTRSSAA